MAENPQSHHQDSVALPDERATAKMALAVYALYALGAVFTVGLLSIVGLVLAYNNRREAAGSWVETHFQWQIRTFWIGLLFGVISVLTLPILIGVALGLLTALWMLLRVVIGWSHLAKERAIPDPETWLF